MHIGNGHETATEAIVREHIARVAEAREQACEMMLLDGQRGVLELQRTDGAVEFFVTISVPYGHIFEWNEHLNGPFPWPRGTTDAEG